MTVKQRLAVAWVATLANASFLGFAESHHRGTIGAVIVGISCVILGWLL